MRLDGGTEQDLKSFSEVVEDLASLCCQPVEELVLVDLGLTQKLEGSVG